MRINGKPVKFYPYPHVVIERIVSFDLSNWNRAIRQDLLNLFNNSGISCQYDNKIAFEIETDDGKQVFFGFHDLTFSIGFAVRELN